MVVHACDPSTWEAEAHPHPHPKIFPKKTRKCIVHKVCGGKENRDLRKAEDLIFVLDD